MTDLMFWIVAAILIIFTSIIIWSIMTQRMTRMIEKTRSESEMKIADYRAREDERKIMKEEQNVAMSDSFKLMARQAFEDVKNNAEIEKKEEFKRVTDDFSTILKGEL